MTAATKLSLLQVFVELVLCLICVILL